MPQDIIDAQFSSCATCEEAADEAHGVAVLTEWDAFKEADYARIHRNMHKPAFLFDGRNILDHEKLRNLGFDVYAIGKGMSK